MNALIGLALVAMATTFLMESVAASLRAERLVRERFVAVQWLAGALDELRTTGKMTIAPPPSLRAATITTRRAPVAGASVHSYGSVGQVTLEATWREASGVRRSASLTGVIAGNESPPAAPN